MMNKEPKITVITLNYNGKDLLDKHYTSLLNQSYSNFDTLLVDNGSNDGSENFVKKNFPQVKIKKIKKNVGPVKGYMEGIKSVPKGSSYVVICGNDTWFDNDWLKEQVAIVVKNPKIAIAGGLQMNYTGTTEINKGVSLDIFGYPLAKGSKPFYIDGAAIFLNKKVFFEAGGFDESFWVYDEEVDLAWRVKLLGYSIAVVTSAIFYHLGGATLSNEKKEKNFFPVTTSEKRYLTEKNTLRMIIKNYSLPTLIIIIPIFFSLNLLEGIFFIFLGKPQLFKSHFRAWIWNVKNISDTFKFRSYIQKRRRIQDKEIMKDMIKGWGKFSSFKIVGIPKFR